MQFTQVRAAFRKFDEDKSGTISREEMRRMFQYFGLFDFAKMTEKEFGALINRYDPDGSGELDYNEFLGEFGASIAGVGEGASLSTVEVKEEEKRVKQRR